MSALKIVKMGNPVLRKTAKPVVFPLDSKTEDLISRMAETLMHEEGAGLAAPQVGDSLRIVVALLGGAPHILLNPVLTMEGEDMEWGLEGCLSIPGLRGVVPRFQRISWTAQNMAGEPVSGTAEGFSARLLQHEVDHLDGILYPDRMPDLRLLTHVDEIENFLPGEDPGSHEGEQEHE